MTRPAGPAPTGTEQIEQLCDRERWVDARPLVGRLLAAEPENPTAWCLLAQCELGLGRPDRAVDAAGHAAALDPDNEWPYRLQSFAFNSLDRPDDAVRSAREAVRLDPAAWPTHTRLAAAALRQQSGRSRRDRRAVAGRAEAARSAGRALALAPDEPQVHLIHGTVAVAQGRCDVAERAYRTALELDPQHSGAHHLLAALNRHRHPGPAGLARSATGFVTALTIDPTAQVSRRSLELTLRAFLGRAAAGLLVAAYLSQLFAVRPDRWSRAAPLLLLALPALFVAAFLRRLDPRLRAFLRRSVRRGWTAVAVVAGAGCVVLMSVGVFAPQVARTALAAAAAATALGAYLVSKRGGAL